MKSCSPFSAAKCHGKNPDGQGFKGGDFFAPCAEKYDPALDGLDRRNGAKCGLLFAACYAIMAVDFFLIFGKGRWDMGRFAEVSKKVKDNRKSFEPIELTEGNVQAIFNRCSPEEDSKDFAYATLFPITRGWEIEDAVQIQFDNAKLLKDKKAIQYLFGQLQEVHTYSKTSKKQDVAIDDYNTTYSETNWTRDKETLLKFLYLGVASLCCSPFFAETKTSLISPAVKPTLSPKDPTFPEWWEQHKAEWEG